MTFLFFGEPFSATKFQMFNQKIDDKDALQQSLG